MAWTTPTTRSTGDLISASNWNTDLVNNLKYLREPFHSAVATSQSITSTSYDYLTTHDTVTVDVASSGVISIAVAATWFESVSGAARAAIFIGSNQLKGISGASSVPVVQETPHGNTATVFQPLYTTAGGLKGDDNTGGWADVSTGQIIGSIQDAGSTTRAAGLTIVSIGAGVGSYEVSLRFKATSGTVGALNRNLWVWTT